MKLVAVFSAAVFLAVACSADEESATGRGGVPPDDPPALSVAEAHTTRPAGRVVVEGALLISYLGRESTRLCARVVARAAPRCVTPAFRARIPAGPIEGLESTPDGLVIWSPRPMRFVGSFRRGVFVVERIVR